MRTTWVGTFVAPFVGSLIEIVDEFTSSSVYEFTSLQVDELLASLLMPGDTKYTSTQVHKLTS